MRTIKKKKKKKLSLILPITIAIIIVLGLWLWNYLTLIDFGDTERGTFGDMFGSVNAVFSGLAFAGIIITIYIQSHELKLQRKELKLTRKEARRTRGELVLQNETMLKQQFENTFFQMLSMFNHNVENQFYTNINNTYSKKDVFDFFTNSVNSKMRSIAEDILEIDHFNRGGHNKEVDNKIVLLLEKDVLNSIKDGHVWYSNVFYSYFLTFTTILKLIDKSEVKEKELYASIVKSQLNISELITILYKCIVNQDDNEFNYLVRKFDIIENLGIGNFKNEFIRKEFQTYKNV